MLPRISRLNRDTAILCAAAILAITAATAGHAAPLKGHAAPLKHDIQHVVLRDRADARHDRAPCPLQTVTPG